MDIKRITFKGAGTERYNGRGFCVIKTVVWDDGQAMRYECCGDDSGRPLRFRSLAAAVERATQLQTKSDADRGR